MSPKISIAMATYNGEKFILEQLDSISHQTVLPYEVVICDDGSVDSTPELVDQFSKNAPFAVKFYRNECNLGYGDNFLKAALLCTGDWVAFCDQDDIWLPKKLEIVLDRIMRYPDSDLMIVAHTSLIADEHLNLTGVKWPNFSRDSHVKPRMANPYHCISGFSLIFNSVLINDFDSAVRPCPGPSGKKISHDIWISILGNALGSCYHISVPLAIWRRHGKSFTTSESLAFAEKSFIHQVKRSASTRDAAPYYLEGEHIKLLAESFEALSISTSESKWRYSLKNLANDLGALSSFWTMRGDLYQCNNFVARFKAYSQLVLKGGYFGTYNKLGWRSSVKDAVFTFGILDT